VSADTEDEKSIGIKIIVTFDEAYRAYQGTLAAVIRILRPDAEVITTEPEKIDELARRLAPDLVIGSRSEDEGPDGVRAWIELAPSPTQTTKVRVGGRRSEMTNPTLDKLLMVIEDVEQLKRAGDL
jgi:hypothetical protein